MPENRQDADGTRTAPPTVHHQPVAPTHTRPLADGGGIDAHRHDDHQIVYAGRGVLAVTTDAGTWVAPATRAIWIPAGTVHAHRAYGQLDLHTVGLPATDNPLGLSAPTVLTVGPLLRELLLAYTRPEDAPPGPPSHEDVNSLARNGSSRSAAHPHAAPAHHDTVPFAPPPPRRETPERRRLRAVLLDQLRASPQQPVHLPAPSDPRLAAVCALLHENPADNRTLARLGAEVGAGARTLTRLFQSDLGMTFPQWRTQLRLYHALRLLAEDVPVTSVAHRCGWSSTSAFIDVFRRAFGHTPGSHHRTER